MKESKTRGILLKRTLLANDDAFLEFFTEEFGRVKLSVKKFAASRKRAAEIDFFRLLELGIFEGRHSKSLKSANAVALFHGFETSFQAHELGFSWISKLQFILPEEKPAPNLFETVIQMFQHFDAQFSVPFDLFFRVVTLGYLGLLSPFEKNQESLLALSNGRTPTSAQEVIAFLEQADFETFFEKKKLLPRSKFAEVVRILEQKEKNYF